MKILRLFAVLLVLSGIATAAPTPARDLLRAQLSEYLAQHYTSVAASPISTGILYDLVLPMSGIEKLDGSGQTEAVTFHRWLQIAHELKRASLTESPLPDHTVFRNERKSASQAHVYPLAFLDFRYQRVEDKDRQDELLTFDGRQITGINVHLLSEGQVFAMSALNAITYHGENVAFTLDLNTHYFSNQSELPIALEIDFGDGQGFHRMSGQDQMTAHYSSTGTKTLEARATFTDRRTLVSRAIFEVRSLRTPSPDQTWPMQSHLPYNGAYANGEAYVYLANGHATITNPVIVSEGFDPDNSLNWDELYSMLNEQDLLETMKAMGYDAIVLNYADAIAYIQSNAYLVEALIDTVNSIVGPDQTIALVGASMGGLTTRFALTDMEANEQAHHVRTWITFDTPHRGANIPLGIQYWINFFADESADAALFRDALNLPAAREMLLAHFTNPASNVAESDPLFAVFFTELSQLGDHPLLPRSVAIANGAANQQGMDFSPGAQIIRYEYDSFVLDIRGNVWALNNTLAQTIFYGEMNLIWPFPDEFQTVTVQPSSPWDNAPGGMSSTMAEMDSLSLPYGDLIALHPSHCFIPTISALNLNLQDPFYNIAGDPNLYSHTTFDSLYFPSWNQGHVTITPENRWWFLQEICDTLPAPVVVIESENESVRLSWQPIAGVRGYRVSSSLDNETWPEAHSFTSDTTWVDPELSSEKKYFRVTVTLAAD